MTRAAKASNIESRTARTSLAARVKPYFRLIEPGLFLGYRRLTSGPGTWVVKRYNGDGKYTVRNLTAADGRLVIADDETEANGNGILKFAQAQVRAKAEGANATDTSSGPYTVNKAMDDYLAFLTAEGRDDGAIRDAGTRINAFIRPTLGKFEVAALSVEQLRKWRADLAKAKARVRTRKEKAQKFRKASSDQARKSTANRILSTLKAGLNHAFDEEKVASNKAWGRRLKPFQGADAARPGYLSIAEAKRLINTTEPDFRKLVQAALLTGARYQQIAKLRVKDFNGDIGTVDLRSKKGRGRVKQYSCVLTDEGVRFFKTVCAGRAGADLMFTKANGDPWEKGHQSRLMIEACARVKITPKVGYHQLRHTYASHSIMNGTPPLVVAQNLGQADTKMIERHYQHLAPSFKADAIRAGAPKFDLDEQVTKVVALD